MNLSESETIELRKLIEEIERRFTSGNSVPVERAHIKQHEWHLLRRAIKENSNVS